MSKKLICLAGMGRFSYNIYDLPTVEEKYENFLKRIKGNMSEREIVNVSSINSDAFKTLCNALKGNTSLKYLKIKGNNFVEWVQSLVEIIIVNRTIISLNFEGGLCESNDENINSIKVLTKRNKAIVKIAEFITKNFSNGKTISFKNIDLLDYGFLKYYLPSNKPSIYKQIQKTDNKFTNIVSCDNLLEGINQLAFLKVVNSAQAGNSYFAFLPHEIMTNILGNLDNCGIPDVSE